MIKKTILDVKQIMSAPEESELREKLRKTRLQLKAQGLAAALMEPKPGRCRLIRLRMRLVE